MHRRGQRRRGQAHFLRTTRLLVPAVALFLHRHPSHGYTLLERLYEFGLGGLDNGTVYRALRDMENNGWLISTWDAEKTQGPPRRVYSLTGKGDQMLRAWVQDLYQARDQINLFLAAYERHMAEDVGAFHNR
jgi:PadR family transcriptional regulator PadR